MVPTFFDGHSWYWLDMENYGVFGPFILEAEALDSAEQTAILRQLEIEDAKTPKRDGRMLARNAGRKLRRTV